MSPQMIPLFRKDFPSPRDDLAQALDAAIHRFIQKSGRIVDLRSRVFPLVDEIRITLDGAKFDFRRLPFTNPEGETKPAFEAALVTVSGRHGSVYGAALDLRMETRDVVFPQAAASQG